ncbi:MAG: hypothetical protein IJX77_01000 [Ruminococcus sp.]|nr:hypothetical protein [Ruminococcus sp.]
MRTTYREKFFKCGNYLEVNIYPVYRKATQRSRKAKPSRKVQINLNKRNRENKIIRLLNANFTSEDLKLELTYKKEFLPQSDEEAAKELRNFFRRVKRYREKNGLPKLKYIAVTEKGSKNSRYHHHVVMSGGIDIVALTALWGRGYTNAAALQFDIDGLAALGKYMIKDPISAKKTWNSSKNLIHPQPKCRDGRLSKRKVIELARDTENSREYEKYYPGYYFSSAHVVTNDINNGVYIQARFYSPDAELYWNTGKKLRQKQKKIDGVQLNALSHDKQAGAGG